MTIGSYRPETNRLPPVHKIPNAATGGSTIWCPHDGAKMVYERININNYLCPFCFYELPKPERPNQPDDATISTIDGWVDIGYFDQGTKTAKFRPVEGPRKDADTLVREHPVVHPDTQRMIDESSGAIKIIDSEEVVNRSDNILDLSGRKQYNPKVRRR